MKKMKEVSALSGLSARTLQYYDERGLLTVERSAENYRLYGEEDLQRLWKILLCREMGFPLDEIRALLERRFGKSRREDGKVQGGSEENKRSGKIIYSD